MASIRLKSIILFLRVIAVYGTNAVLGQSGTILTELLGTELDISTNPTCWLSTNYNSSIQCSLYFPGLPNDLFYLEPDVSNSCELIIYSNTTCCISKTDHSIQYHHEYSNELFYLEPEVSNSCKSNISSNPTCCISTNNSNQHHPYSREYPNEFCFLEPYVPKSCKFNISSNIPFLPPKNDNNSIQYHFYTPDNPYEFCYFEPVESNDCEFNESYEVKILIHGFTVKLLPGNYFEQIKDTFLKYNKYNVIIVNWTKYDGNSMEEYPMIFFMVYPVARAVGQMVNFLVEKGVNPSDIHIIGHSLGAHIAGVAGEQVPNLGRVTGLDPAGPFFSMGRTFDRLTNTSAILVDVIHTSNFVTGVGLGFPYAIGSIDFYPNGGNEQPACQMGGHFINSDAELVKITTTLLLACCHHDMVLPYFLNSIRICNYPSVKCESYEWFSAGKCDVTSNPTNKMGLFCKLIPDLPAESTFYLNTSAESPYCEI